MARLDTLRDLAACLRGAPPPGCDWPAVVSLANQSLTTPQLAAAVLRSADPPPADIVAFLEEVLGRNRERNRRLWRQLVEALEALNARGIVPVALKGAALWLWSGEASDRLLSDIDLLVEPAEAKAAITALEDAGFRVARRQDGALAHVVAELGRPQDAGYIDLHQRPPGPPGVVETADFAARYREVEGRRVRAPDAAAQILHLVLHDQFHDGDYWRGGFTLRHLRDIAALAPSVDWGRLFTFARTELCRRAVEVELRAAARFAGADVPASALGDGWARIQHERQLLQFAWPKLSAAIAAAALVSEWPALSAHRRADRADQQRMFGTPAHMGFAARAERLGHIFGGFAAGKV